MSSSYPPPPPPGPGEDPYAAPSQAYPSQGYPAAPGNYGSMPGQVPGAPTGPVTRPPAMDRAVLFMKVGAGLSLLSLVVGFTQSGSTKQAITDAAAKSGKTLTTAEVNSLYTFSLALGVVIGLVGVGLWLWMASANGKGKSWARIVASVLFALSLVFGLFGLAQATSTVNRIGELLSILVGAGAMFYMYKKESTDFYRASSAPRA